MVRTNQPLGKCMLRVPCVCMYICFCVLHGHLCAHQKHTVHLQYIM